MRVTVPTAKPNDLAGAMNQTEHRADWPGGFTVRHNQISTDKSVPLYPRAKAIARGFPSKRGGRGGWGGSDRPRKLVASDQENHTDNSWFSALGYRQPQEGSRGEGGVQWLAYLGVGATDVVQKPEQQAVLASDGGVAAEGVVHLDRLFPLMALAHGL